MRTQASLISLFASLACAWNAPSYSGYNLVWQSTFPSASGTSPDTSQWNIITGNLGVNAELETYSSSTKNVQNSGGGTLQIVPWRDSSVSGGWTSGRLESKYTFTPAAGKRTMGESQIRFGTNAVSSKKGIWPAFWLLGDVLRHGGSWPSCGELDVLETVNGQLTGYGTAHCDVYPGGICNEGNGIGSSISIPDQSWHTWRIVWDRTPSSWQSESITWYMDGQQFQQITGSRIGNQNVWNSLAHSAEYFILNVAVGGSWPGYPDSTTLDGYGAMMEVGYVAHYQSS
ncbi:secreted glucosidase [Coniochaeta ligniaria NRRL 30616]|uniref:Secreted glucosidase n=1 Tax=Coniochaeta ligniaria NRRL 30616 TaxID=1408157 RepID=A0A1J7JKW6_9PEZI|nr:secreted glucosidase [Coniochaeta ligniaria NRRL 30616]